MKIDAAVDAVYNAIYDLRFILVDGISHQGTDRQIKTLNKSNLSGWSEPYAITIHCSGAEEKFKPAANTLRGASSTIYNMEVHVVDTAFPQYSDDVAYNMMHRDFRILVGRLVDALKDTTVTFTDGTNNFTLVPLSNVTFRSRTDWYDLGNETTPFLYAVITFDIRGCE